jgi:hypothetical protein
MPETNVGARGRSAKTLGCRSDACAFSGACEWLLEQQIDGAEKGILVFPGTQHSSRYPLDRMRRAASLAMPVWSVSSARRTMWTVDVVMGRKCDPLKANKPSLALGTLHRIVAAVDGLPRLLRVPVLFQLLAPVSTSVGNMLPLQTHTLLQKGFGLPSANWSR